MNDSEQQRENKKMRAFVRTWRESRDHAFELFDVVLDVVSRVPMLKEKRLYPPSSEEEEEEEEEYDDDENNGENESVVNIEKEYNMENIINDMMHKNLGEIVPYSGEIILSSDMWKTYAYSGQTYSRTKNYYTLLHEIGHILGIGSMWRLNGAMLYDELSQSFFYGGSNGNREYKNLFTNIDVLYMPIEDDGGPGTSNVHPEKGEHGHVSKNNRYYNGILHPGIENEIMTGWLDNNAGNTILPLSRITIGIIHDMGYDVDYTKADIFYID